jgi:arsenate reductase
MREVGIDISKHRSKLVEEFAGQDFDYVLTVCDNAKENCPFFPATTKRIHWSIEDPAAVEGSEDGRLAAFRRIRDELRGHLQGFLQEQHHGNTAT